MQAFSSGEEGDMTSLVSPRTNITSFKEIYCVSFMYMLYGSGAGELQLHVNHTNGQMEKKWHTFGDQGLKWHHSEVQIIFPQSDFYLVFVSQQGYPDSATAIDDISLKHERCSTLEGKVTSRHTYESYI